MLAAVKAAGAAKVLEEDIASSAESQVEIDILKEGWKAYVQQLFASDHLEGHRRVSVRKVMGTETVPPTSLVSSKTDPSIGEEHSLLCADRSQRSFERLKVFSPPSERGDFYGIFSCGRFGQEALDL